MRIIKTAILSLSIALALQSVAAKTFASGITEFKVPPQYEAFRGLYKLSKAKGPAKKYCSKIANPFFTKVDHDKQEISILNATARILMPVANIKKQFADPVGCVTEQVIQLIETQNQSILAIEEVVTVTCADRVQISNRFLELKPGSKKLTFRSSENGKLNARCEWIKQ